MFNVFLLISFVLSSCSESETWFSESACGKSVSCMQLNRFTSAVWGGCEKKRGRYLSCWLFLALQWAYVNWYSSFSIVQLLYLLFFYLSTWLSYICIALLFKLQSALRLFWIFLNMILFILHLVRIVALFFFFRLFFRADLPSMATCILTSMRDLYSVTLHFPFSPQWESDLGPRYLPEFNFSIALGLSEIIEINAPNQTCRLKLQFSGLSSET